MGNQVSLSYTRPKHVDPPSSHNSILSDGSYSDEKNDGSLKSGSTGSIPGIPAALSFDRIMDGGTCPPCTVRDFMNFLLYIEHSAENLQFFLWSRDYERRFRAADATETALSPEWTRAQSEEVLTRLRRDNAQNRRHQPEAVTELFKGTEFEANVLKPSSISGNIASATKSESGNPFETPPRTPASAAAEQESIYPASNIDSSNGDTIRKLASGAFSLAGVRQPFTIQPFRQETNRVIAMYIMEGAPRQLNLSSSERVLTVAALSKTTHPSALSAALKSVETTLRRQAHPNFIRWSICNGNRPRVTFARWLGVFLIAVSTLLAILLTLSGVPRGFRALAAIGWVLGISTLIAAYKGMCVVLHGMHHLHVRPWELFVTDNEANAKRSFDSFGSANSYEDEPWVAKYDQRNLVRKIFDHQRWVQEPALRQVQDTIFIQAMLGALLGAGVLTVVFVLLPCRHVL